MKNYYEFREYYFPKIGKGLIKYLEFLYCIKSLFNTVKEDKIVIIESGCFGIIPMFLSYLDSSVTIKMFTLVTYVLEILKNRIYKKAYEKNRHLETLKLIFNFT